MQTHDVALLNVTSEHANDQYSVHDVASEPTTSALGTRFNSQSTREIITLTHVVAAPEIIPSPNHMPTMLIEYWFRHVCPARSTFDSDINYNRQVAWNTWSTSDAVSSTIQAMAAACLVHRKPQLSEILLSLKSQALTAVCLGINQVQDSTGSDIKAGLMFAVLSLGTSLHWFAPASRFGSEYSWLQSARNLLSIWKTRLAASECLLYAYFSQALMYWDLLLAPLGRGSFPMKIGIKRQQLQHRLEGTLGLSVYDTTTRDEWIGDGTDDFLGTRPNSWCGVSSEVINLHGQVLALCHSVSIRSTTIDISPTERAYHTLCNMSIARELQRELLAMSFDTLVLLEEAQGFPVQTQDGKTPMSHLLQTAEGFRKAALLQLHLTFEDLPILQVFPSSDSFVDTSHTRHLSRNDMLLELVTDLAKILENIPIDSGCTSIHPILYLAVAVGFCNIEESTPWLETYQAPGIHEEHPEFEVRIPIIQDLSGTRISQSEFEPSTNGLLSGSSTSMDISKARLMTLSRLKTLQHMLPHASSGQVLQVVKAIWAAYDDKQACGSSICWFTIVREISPETLLWS